MTDWNRDGRIDAADIATEYAAYNAIMNSDSKPRRSTRQTSGNGAGAAWAIVAAAIIGILIAIAR